MSSLILHLCISETLKQKYNFSNEFLVGAIAPDIYKKHTNDRKATHYIEIIDNNGKIKKLPNIDNFLEKNKDRKDEFFLGYLSHLIQDKIWFDKYIPMHAENLNETEVIYKKDNSKHTNAEFSKQIYMDYAVEDRFILSKVSINLSKIRESAKKYFNNTDISQIIDNEVKLFPTVENRDNVFLTNTMIEQYFNECIEKCSEIISENIK